MVHTAKTVDSFKHSDGCTWELVQYQNRYDKMQIRHYLFINGKEVHGISPKDFERYKNNT